MDRNILMSAIMLLLSGLTGLFAQEAIPATSGNASGSGGSVMYSAGQVFYKTYTGPNGSLAQGVNHNYAIEITTGLDLWEINLNYLAYPNPTTDLLTIEIEDLDKWDLSFLLFDQNGKLLIRRKLKESMTTIDMTDLVTGAYFLKVLEKEEEVKAFRIIKY